jgi:hypothetical protein
MPRHKHKNPPLAQTIRTAFWESILHDEFEEWKSVNTDSQYEVDDYSSCAIGSSEISFGAPKNSNSES